MSTSILLQKYLGKLGIEPDAITVYIELVKHGHSTALQLAKATHISRTQTYRHLELLQRHDLASAEQLSYGTLYRPLPIENIDGLLANRDAETAAIRRNLETMAAALQSIAGGYGPKATVEHFYGIAGLKQARWNITQARASYKVCKAAHLSAKLDRAFARRYQERCMERGLTNYELTNDLAVRAKDIEPFDVTRIFLRHIDPVILPIKFEMCLYNDVITLLDYTAANSMAIEIHHPTLHAMMEQLFDAMWAQATPLEIS